LLHFKYKQQLDPNYKADPNEDGSNYTVRVDHAPVKVIEKDIKQKELEFF
jgi:hypothetical protein